MRTDAEIEAAIKAWNEHPRDADTKRGDVMRAALAAADAVAPRSAAPAGVPAADAIGKLKRRIDSSLNDYLCEMKPNYDDSIVGFNEAWDVVRKAFGNYEIAPAGVPDGSQEAQWLANAARQDAKISASEVEFFRQLKAGVPDEAQVDPDDPAPPEE